jgi:hypothetical protein
MTRSIQRNRRSGRSRRNLLLAIVGGTIAIGAVGLFVAAKLRSHPADRTTVKGAYAQYVAIAEKGNYEAMYPMLVKDVQAQIATTHANFREAAALVQSGYPMALRGQALADIGAPEVRQAADPAHYFGARIAAAGHTGMSIVDRMGSRLKKIEQKIEQKVPTGRYTVYTVSGATLEFVQGGDGLFYLVPDPRDVQQLHHEFLRSIETLDATRKAVQTFSGTAVR